MPKPNILPTPLYAFKQYALSRLGSKLLVFGSCTISTASASVSEGQSGQRGVGRLLRHCTDMRALADGRHVHACMIKTGFESKMCLENNLVNMYGKCGSVVEARHVFDKMTERNVVSWTSMISGYVHGGHHQEALQLFREMKLVGIVVNQYTLSTAVKACGSQEQGNQVQAHAIKSGMDSDLFVGNALVDMYAKRGNIDDAQKAFQKLQRDSISCNVMISGYAQNGWAEAALKLFSQMQRAGIQTDQFTYASVIRACASLAALEQGKQVHTQIIKIGFDADHYVGGSLVDAYAKCASVGDARKVFDTMFKGNVVSGNAMIAGYVQNGHVEEALKLFQEMYQTGMEMDHFTFASVLGACAGLAVLKHGNQIHANIIKNGFESDNYVGNALVDMYAKCENIEDAHKLFNKMHKREVISWTALIGGYAQNGHGEEALKQYCEMQWTSVKPNHFTFATILRACASLAALEKGKQINVHIVKTGFESDVFAGSALVDMYAKCGNMEDACKVFESMPKKNVVSWTAMIVGYAHNGFGRDALQLFEQMQQAGMKPNHVTLVGVLFACSHAGLLDEGHRYFESMSLDYGIRPRVEHYACMVDILGRAGRLKEAEDLINDMPFEACALLWRILLGACRIHGDIELGKHAAECVLELEPQDGPTYVLLSNTYAAAGKWNDVAKVRKMMKDRAVRKGPARSWIEVKDRVHAFVVGDRSHPQMEEIYAKLDELIGKMKEAGYVPETNSLLYDAEQEHKEQSLCYCSKNWQ